MEYCLRAVHQCVDRGSYAEAVAQFETGLEQLQKLPDDERRAKSELDLRDEAFPALWPQGATLREQGRVLKGRVFNRLPSRSRVHANDSYHD